MSKTEMHLKTRVWTAAVVLSVIVPSHAWDAAVGTAQNVQDGGDTDFVCKDLKGICFGLCTAADVVGCFEESPIAVCRLLEKKLEKRGCGGFPPSPAICPYEGQTAGGVTWSDAFEVREDTCISSGASENALVVEDKDGHQLVAGTSDGDSFCQMTGDDESSTVLVTEPELKACLASLREIAGNDGEPCPSEP